ncbi:MAG: YdcF family protein, partial [Bacteroidota bacterium]
MLVVLGHTNDSKGRLSKVAMSRCALLYEFWKENEEEYILATGTFGVNFNITDKPHYEYLYEYLVELGIPKSNLLDGVMSTNTYEDIIGIRKRIIDREENRVCIVTSDFHQERTSFICGRILQNINFKVAAAKTDSSKLDFYMSKERKSIEVSRQEIFFFPIYLKPNDEFPVSIYQNANQEHKHYDNLSIVSISGQLVVYGFGIKH